MFWVSFSESELVFLAGIGAVTTGEERCTPIYIPIKNILIAAEKQKTSIIR
jgi:hypothetical protein